MWEDIHKVEKDKEFWACKTNTYDLKKTTKPFSFVRLVLDEARPGCPFCMQVNQIELYGETTRSTFIEIDDTDESDESVSIIGKIKKESD